MPDEQQLTPLPVHRAYDLRALADSSYARCPFCGCKSASTHKADCTIELAARALESLLSERATRVTCEHGTIGYCEKCALRDPGELGEQKPQLVSSDKEHQSFDEWWLTCPASTHSNWIMASKDYARWGWEASARAHRSATLPLEPTMGMWDDFCAVHKVPFDAFLTAYRAMIAGMCSSYVK